MNVFLQPVQNIVIRIGLSFLVAVGILLSSAYCLAASTTTLFTPGTSEGQLNVGPDGGASYSIPIRVPPGTAGIEPKLALAYSSRGGPSPFGFGWTVAGLSSVQRGPRNLSEDGVVRGAYLDDKDGLYLDGAKLIQVSARADGSREFRTRLDNYSRIRAYEWNDAGPQRLVVNTRAGLKLFFGTTDAARVRVEAGGPPLIWLCDRIEDSAGNYMTLSYAVDGLNYRISEIAYTGNQRTNLKPYAKVSFEYTQVEPYDLKYIHGHRAAHRSQLRRIVSYFRGSVLREYKPSFERIDRFRPAQKLVALTESGGDGLSYRPLKFLYSSAAGGWKAEQGKLPDEVLSVSSRQKFEFANVQGDSAQELLYRFTAAGQQKAGTFAFANGTPTKLDSKWTPPVDLVGFDYRLTDLDGDGFVDLLSSGAASYIADKNQGWRSIPNERMSFRLMPSAQSGSLPDNRFLLIPVEVNGSPQAALIWSSPRQSPAAGAFRLAGDKWIDLPQFRPPHPFPVDASGQLHGVYAVDANCDQRPELIYNHAKADGSALREVYRSTAKGWELVKDTGVQLPFEPLPHSAALKLVDLNKDDCKDLVVSYRSGNERVQKAWLASADGWKADPRALPNVVFWEGKAGQQGRLFAELGDLRGDGTPVIFWRRGSGAGARAGAARLGDAEWERDDSFAPPRALPGDLEERQLAFAVIGVHGKGKTQLAYFDEQGPPEIYSHGGVRWALDRQLTPPQTIAQYNKADLGVRFPDLDGDGYADIAYTKKTSAGTLEKVAYRFNPGSPQPWTADVRFRYPQATFSEDLKDTGVFLVDFNGDGLHDLLYSYQPADQSKPAAREAYVNCRFMPECAQVPADKESGYWKSVTDPIFNGRYSGYVPPEAFTEEGAGSRGFRALDFNGDGLTDLVASREEDDPKGLLPPRLVQRVFINRVEKAADGRTGGKWVELQAAAVLPAVAFTRPLRTVLGESESKLTKVRDNRVELMDLDGDRLPDVMYSFVAAVPKPESEEERKRRLEQKKPIEFESKHFSGAYLNRGGAWVPAPAYIPKHRLDADDTATFEYAKSATQVSFQDMNGDGLADLVYAERCDNPCAPGRPDAIHATYLNSGAGWVREAAFDIPLEALLKNTKGDQGYRLLDVNADGLADVVYHRIIENEVHEKGAFLNTGIGWLKTKESDSDASKDGYAPPIAFVEAQRGDLGVRPLDLNGDGIVDLVQIYQRSDSETASVLWINEPFMAPTERPFKTDLLAEVMDGLGRQSQLRYQSYIGTAYHQDDKRLGAYLGSRQDQQEDRRPEYPVLDPPMPGYVATTLQVQGPGIPQRTSNYRYRGYRVNTLTGHSLGFEVQEINDVERKRTSIIKFLQADGLVGSVGSTEIWQTLPLGRRVQISGMLSDFSVLRRAGLPLDGGFVPEILRSTLDRMKSVSKDLRAITVSNQTDEFQYDSNGNPVRIKTTFADGSGSETVNRYQDDLVKWHLARLTESTVTQLAPGTTSQTRVAKFAYSPETGQLIKEVSLAGTPYETSIEYQRDSFGNKISSKTSVTSGLSRTSRVAFDALGRFPIASTNHLGHVSSAQFDEVSGVITARIDPNGIRQSVRYDSLQRVRQEIDPTGVVTSTRTEFATASGLAFSVSKQVGALPPTTTAHDVAGRLRWQGSVGFDGKTVIVEYNYDALGRLTQSSIPRFEGELPKYHTRRYDALDRQVEERRPDGTVWRTGYEGLKTAFTDPLKRETVVEKDARGRTWLTLDPLKGRTQFEFDVAGKATRIINALGHVSRAEYNIAGQRIALDDPTLGRWTYKYNGFGELVEQTDARGEMVTLRYDDLGRLLERKSKTGSATYRFDEGPNAIGRLSLVKSTQGSARSIGYDRFGRVRSVEFRVGGDGSKVEQSYDDLSRPLERRYSSGLIISNAYDEQGFWRRVNVSGSSTARVAWESLEVDALGRVTQERLGNGTVNAHMFDSDTARLASATSRGANGTAIQDFTLDYDVVGNVIQRVDRPGKTTERFEYDELNRITKASRPMSEQVALNYDALGNILEKTDTGSYQYCDNERTRILCSLKSASGGVMKIEYDSAGNIMQMGDKRLTYDSEGRVSHISDEQRNRSSFRYGADGELIHQQSQAGQTRFEVTYLGDTQILREAYAPSFRPTPERTRVRHFIASPSGTVGFFETTYWHFPFRHAAPLYRMLVMDNPLRSSEVTSGMTYFVKDQLGSLRATLNDKGEVTERFDYDAWGKRRQNEGRPYHAVRQGFTGHEHLDNLGLIHMGGRIYSPTLARFVSPDPFVQHAGYSQAHNRYAYVLNNPLRLIDPTGYWGISIGDVLGDAWDGITNAVESVVDAVVGEPLRWIGEQLHKAGNWLQQNWKTVAIIAASVALGPAGVGLNAVLVGAMIGGGSAALYGGSFEDIVRGAVIGAIVGGLSSGITASVKNQYATSFLQGHVGGVRAGLEGGRYEQGFAAGFAGSLAASHTEAIGNADMRLAADAAAGGVVSSLGGGSFENGAIFGAFRRSFTDTAEGRPRSAIATLLVRAWNLPNTAVGAAYAGLGYAAGKIAYWTGLGADPQFSLQSNSITLENNPLTVSHTAIAIGNTVSYGKGLGPGTVRDSVNIGMHEQAHTYQYEVLGPLFVPAYLTGLIAGPGYHNNFLEKAAEAYGSGGGDPLK